MPLEDIAEIPDPADQLRADIESAIEGQRKEPLTEATVEKPAPEPAVDVSEDGRERDDKGRFVAKTESTEEDPKAVEAPKEAKTEAPALEASKGAMRPPPGFSIASKVAWDKETLSPEEWAAAKADIAKREQEVDNGFKRYGGLGKFAEEAERNGTTLQSAVSDYVGIETALRQNFIGGIEFICQRMGVDPRQLSQVMGARYNPAGQGAGQSAEVPASAQQVPQQPVQAIDPRAIAEHVTNVVRAEAEQRELNSQIASFSADPTNKFFPDVRQDMAKIVQAGKADNIKDAYEAACWLNPEIRAILINEANGGRNKEAAAAASKSRSAAKAIGGAPAPGVNPDMAGHRKNLSLDEEIRAAVDAQVGAA
jgi:hypothetical protein